MGILRRALKFAPSGFQTILDSFNRADSTTTMGNTDTGQTWVPNAGTWGINFTANSYCATSTGDLQNTTVVESTISDAAVESKLASVGDMGLCWRSSDNSNHFVVGTVSNCTVYRKEAGSFTSVGSNVGTAFANNDVQTMVVRGSAHELLKNGAVWVSFTDAFNQTATKHGLRSYDAVSQRFDTFAIRKVLAYDTFNRADDTTTMGNADSGQVWEETVGTWGILTNRAYNVGDSNGAQATLSAGATNVTVRVVGAVLGAAGQCGVLARHTDDSNYYLGNLTQVSTDIYKSVAGVFSNIASGAAGAAGDMIEIVADGTSLNLKKNGVSTCSVTDSSLGTGSRAGLRNGAGGNGVRFDNFLVEAI